MKLIQLLSLCILVPCAAIISAIIGFEVGKFPTTTFVLCVSAILYVFIGLLFWKRSRIQPPLFIVAILLSFFFMLGGVWGGYKSQDFRFESYSTGSEAQAALLKLYPVGSDVDKLVSALGRAGADCNLSKHSKYKDVTFCEYIEKEIIFGTSWRVSIWRSDNQHNIDYLNVDSFYETL